MEKILFLHSVLVIHHSRKCIHHAPLTFGQVVSRHSLVGIKGTTCPAKIRMLGLRLSVIKQYSDEPLSHVK